MLPVKRPGARFPTYPVQASWVRFVCRLLNERQPCGIQRAQAYKLIQAMKLRPLLPEVSAAETGGWTEYAIRPLLHKDFTPADQGSRARQKPDVAPKGTVPFLDC